MKALHVKFFFTEVVLSVDPSMKRDLGNDRILKNSGLVKYSSNQIHLIFRGDEFDLIEISTINSNQTQ
jgi:hypothetical protein